MCYHTRHIMVRNEYPSYGFPESYIELDVPCGKCVPCLKRRQSDYSVRLYREVKDADNMFFLTLTYNNQHIPVMQNLYRVNSDTGEYQFIKKGSIVTNDSLLYYLRGRFSQMNSSSQARYVTRYLEDSDGCPIEINGYYLCNRFTPSLYREDVKNWIKGCRVQYERDNGVKLNFRYAWCGEYGSNGCRPHYHLVIIGLAKETIIWMCERWKAKGYYYYKEVPRLNPDGTNARQIACRYIGKYVSKGKFDCNSVTQGEAQKGRLCNSKRFGTADFTSEEVAYYRAYDLYGEYDINSFCKLSPYHTWKQPYECVYLTDKERMNVVKEVVKRATYNISFKSGDVDRVVSCPLPKAFRIRLFYFNDRRYDEKEQRFKNVYRASLLSRKVMDYLQSLVDAQREREFEQFCAVKHLSKDDINSLIAFEKSCEDTSQVLFEDLEEDNFAFEIMSTSKDYQ